LEKLNIMSVIHNTRTAWNEVTATAPMETGRSYGQKHAATWEEVEEETVIQNTVELVNEEGLEGVNEGSVEKLLQSGDERFTNDEIRELAEQRIRSTLDSHVEQETPMRKFSSEFLSSSIVASTRIMDQFTDNDPDYKQSSKAKWGVLEIIS
jgi:hypothetical protein